MATVFIQRRAHKNGVRYAIRYKDPFTGKNKYLKTVDRKKDALEDARRLRESIENGNLPKEGAKNRKYSPQSVKMIADKLEMHWEEKIRNNKLTRGTVDDGYKRYLKQVVRKFTRKDSSELGNMLISEITTEQLMEYRHEEKEKWSAVKANRLFGVVKELFKLAKQEKAVAEDIAKDISHYNEGEHVRTAYLTPKQLDHLIDCAKENRFAPHLPAMIILGAEHGASRQELLDLKWDHCCPVEVL
jgi:integrase